ncbi:MAG: potassium transporter TrkH [Alphaproteobacteria bacterium]|nr:potassium transporter TrkH [Alphaproteobacteria bacterium]
MNFAPVLRVFGVLVVVLAIAMLPSLALAIVEGPANAAHFGLSLVVALTIGASFFALGATSGPFELNRRQCFVVTASAWTALPAFAAIPLLGTSASFVDAYFEATSGFTTTGATVLAGLDDLPASILLWRSTLQWFGGVGIIVLAITMMPFLRVGGMQLFRTESSENADSFVAGSLAMARWIVGIYLALTCLGTLTYLTLGMSLFDAINHAMTTVSTGGFSTHDASFGHFKSGGLQWSATILMACGALPFVAYIRLARGQYRDFSSDVQLRGFVAFLGVVSVFLALSVMQTMHLGFGDAIKLAAFNVVSIVTTTGYASADYQAWGPLAIGAFFLLTFVGGCSGSTAGGIKIYRFQILGRLAHAFLTQLARPSRIVSVTYHGRRVDSDVAYAILAFIAVLLFSLAASTLVLSFLGLDLVTALTASATCLTNVGPGLGAIIGPAGNFAALPDAAKAILSAMMVLGRLEFFTVLVLILPSFWER